MSGEAAYFLCDAHLGSDSRLAEAPREARLHGFLNHLPGRASALYILGDLFDFWFEYRTAIPRRYFETLAALRRVRQAGIPITYLAGNHDFWLGTFLSDTLGIDTRNGPLTLETQGRKLWLHHGDGLVGGDLGYKFLKGVLRHRVSIALYGLLHPDLGIPFALWCSRESRHSRAGALLTPDRLIREIAAPRFADGYDGVVVGHFHHAYEHRDGHRQFMVLGDWIDRFTYAVLEDGELRLDVWPGATVQAPDGTTPEPAPR